MKKLQEKRNRMRLNNLMEKWGYKRDDERPLEAPLAEEEELEEGTREGDDVKDPLVHGEKAYSAYGEEGASGGDEEVDDAEDLFQEDERDFMSMEPEPETGMSMEPEHETGMSMEPPTSSKVVNKVVRKRPTTTGIADHYRDLQEGEMEEMIREELKKYLEKGGE